jgi:glycerate kinase
MKILIAPNSLKNAASAFEIAIAIEAGITKSLPGAESKKMPIADGGQYTMDVIHYVTRGTTVDVTVVDPLGKPILASYGVNPDNSCTIEIARASGYELVNGRDKNPLITSTYGTGLLIRHALEKGCRKFVLALGGTATVDGGAGILQALGIRLLDKEGNDLPPGGGNLIILDRFEPSGMIEAVREAEFTLLCDVQNPLLGAEGAAMVFSPQKGAGPMEAAVLERCLATFADRCEDYCGEKLSDMPGAGAAGGVPVGLSAFFSATSVSGTDYILDLLDADKNIQWSDLVITAEGSLDNQTYLGKAPYILAERAQKAGKKVICLGGSVPHRVDHPDTIFDAVFSIQNRPMTMEESIHETLQSIENTAYEIGKLMQ